MIELIIGAGLVMLATLAAARAHSRAAAVPAELEGEARLGVGDVLVVDDEELWLAGALGLHEAGPVLRLFWAPRGDGYEHILELPGAPRAWARLRPQPIDEGVTPDVLLIDGLRLSLDHRGEARAHLQGETPISAAERAVYAIYRGAGDHVALVIDLDDGQRLSLLGRWLPRERVDLLPGSLVTPPRG